MSQDDNVHFLRPKKVDDVASESDVAAQSASAERTNFDDGIVVRVQDAPPEDPARAKAMEIFKNRSFEDEPLHMGQVLRRVREALGLNLAEISKHSMIRENFLMAIERMEINTIPKGYLTVYLRAYANELGLPPDGVIQPYTAECGSVDEVKSATPVPKMGGLTPQKPKWPIIAGMAATLVVVGATGIGLAQFLRRAPDTDAPPVVAAAVNGGRESLFEKSGTRPQPESLTLELVAVRPGWIEVRGADGTIFRSRVMNTGESYFPRLKAGWTVSAEDGGAFIWRAGELAPVPLGTDGAQVFSVSVDGELARVVELGQAPQVVTNGVTKATR